MNDSWFFDKNFSGVTDDFFDETLLYFDFPLEDVDPAAVEEDWQTKFQELEPPSIFLPNFPSDICCASGNGAAKVEGTSSILQDKSSEFKQCSTISSNKASSSRSISIQCDSSSDAKYPQQNFRTSSPVSVLESSSSSCSAENPTNYHSTIAVPSKRPRSKGLRSQRRTYEFFHRLFSSGRKTLHPLAHLEPESMPRVDEKISSGLVKGIQKKRKQQQGTSSETRRCSHCGVSETPQWREGPLGPKTLCNACGVRHRSGRLFPEYRPAASPTFTPAVHSNSHRKVLELRKKTCTGDGSGEEEGAGSATTTSTA
ncbi:unnamed protein product [Linum trigynum]|uniref:GATA-type domain-containing protein n=1 Tax=Linum trigynum TaxID=586398 RepID=A0AAV2G155_9ROSI